MLDLDSIGIQKLVDDHKTEEQGTGLGRVYEDVEVWLDGDLGGKLPYVGLRPNIWMAIWIGIGECERYR